MIIVGAKHLPEDVCTYDSIGANASPLHRRIQGTPMIAMRHIVGDHIGDYSFNSNLDRLHPVA
jgi:hypothetical protein